MRIAPMMADTSGRMPAVEEEAERVRRAQRVADLTCALLAQTAGLTTEAANDGLRKDVGDQAQSAV